ncbi:M1 family metallopeptidase [bacterium]|nr:MAG: M1 family metallopeptidase [bacterium]
MKKFFALQLILILQVSSTFAQLKFDEKQPQFTRADTLRGMLRPERTSYDVTHYHLDVEIIPDSQFIKGSTTISFKVVDETSRIQIDLFDNMQIDKIAYDNKPLVFTREFNAVFITFPKPLKKNSMQTLVVYFSGKPIVAKHPPWDGGFIWTKDEKGLPWIAVACQGTGASLWWPNKDHQADEPDSMMISVTVPAGLMDISNGSLRKMTVLKDGRSRWDWAVTYPINNYNVTVNVGNFAHFSETYGDKIPLTLDYYVMPSDLEKAKEQFKQVKPMMSVFEKYFGPYPFKRDGYKLVESPHLGMEHQSAVAYGNKFQQGYLGTASSPEGLLFDFIIIHESAHEWWGNSVTSKDIADMWIHEGFGAYSEAIYIEGLYGYEAGQRYLIGKKQDVKNDKPIIGIYDVNQEGSGDMYPKGALMLNTLRHAINNDPLWWAIVRGIQETYKHQTIHTDTVVQFVNHKTGTNYSYLFDQYLKYMKIPELDLFMTIKGSTTKLSYRWIADVPDFRMPVKIKTKNGWETITPTKDWQSMALDGIKPDELKADDNRFFISVNKRVMYVEEKK